MSFQQTTADLAGTVRKLREAYDQTPWDRSAHDRLQEIRTIVNAPPGLMPLPDRGWRSRVSPTDLFAVAVVVGVIVMVAGIRWRMSRSRTAFTVMALTGMIGWSILAWVSLQLHNRPRGFAVVVSPVIIRTGNADTYAAAFDRPLPVGAEVTIHHQRGNWVRVAAGTITGWVPVTCVDQQP